MTETGSIDVLLSPRMALVVDIFRALGDFEASYDVSVIDMLEARLTTATDATTARAVVSDALLLGFALRNQRTDASWPHGDWQMNAIGARQASDHECATLTLIAACKADDIPLADQAARALSVKLNATVSSLARDMGGRLERTGLRIDAADWAPLLDRRGETAREAPSPPRPASVRS
jgi:hypothetical protein